MRRLTGSVTRRCTLLVLSICVHAGFGQRCVSTKLIADDNYRVLESPSYGSYSNDVNWCRRIIAEEDRVIIITLEHVDLEGQSGSCVDYLEVRDGGHPRDESLGRFCQTNSTTIKTTSDEAFLRFRTGRTGTGTGFKLGYRQSESTEDEMWSSALAGIAGGIAIVWIVMCCCCVCTKKKKVINRDPSTIHPIQNYSMDEQSSSAFRQNGDRVSPPRLWENPNRDSNSSSIYHIVFRTNRIKQEQKINRTNLEPTKPPVYEVQDPSPGKLPAYEDIVEEEFSRVISPPPTYRERAQEDVTSPIPMSPPPAYPAFSSPGTSEPYLQS
ncbi:uncharacterized protein LOC110449520 isoform X2 [Mizuhopecten yessoensis]|nr:uncharacterized protein LOC110449520 isoform X2 [Mizuhopecten yessoensis]XP_021352115.1 uncharacterized protein LOC110449520 isoform X2 [Mizuhopecten yessoensis]